MQVLFGASKENVLERKIVKKGGQESASKEENSRVPAKGVTGR